MVVDSAGSGPSNLKPKAFEFSDIWCCVKARGKGWTWILRSVCGEAKAGRSLAVLGPSGSGKTTLLGALGNQIDSGGEVKASQFWITGRTNVPRHNVAFVPQDTPFFSNLTVRETLEFVASLEQSADDERDHSGAGAGEGAGGGGDGGGGATGKRVNHVLRKLGLVSCANTIVGGSTGGHSKRGISGGEKRRLAIACELLRAECFTGSEETTVLIADEPTTGLDAFQADRVVENLNEIAHEKEAIVIMCIHQPRSAIYDRLDDILLLGPGGRVCYMGGAKDACGYFAELGMTMPAHYNPAEFLVDLVSVDTSSEEKERESWKRIEMLYQNWQRESKKRKVGVGTDGDLKLKANAKAKANGEEEVESGKVNKKESRAGLQEQGHSKRTRRGKKAGLWMQFSQLIRRSFLQTRREGYVHLTRAVGTTILALAFGSCHFKLGKGQKGIKRRAAVMMQVCINSSMMSTIKTLNSFPKERVVVRKELSKTRRDGSKLYGIGPYFLSKLLIEAPIDAFFPVLFGSLVGPLSGLNPKMRFPFLGTLALQGVSASALGMSVGALASSTETALAIGPVIMVLSIMLGDSGGMFAEVPKVLQPAAKFSLIKWGFDGCMGSEFRGLTFECDDYHTVVGQEGAGADRSRSLSKYEKQISELMCIRTGEKVLQDMHLKDGCVKRAALAQSNLILYNLLITYILLNMKDKRAAQTFSTSKPPIPYCNS